MAVKRKKTKMDTAEGISLQPSCDNDFMKVTSQEAALSRPFNVVNLTSPHLKNLHIRGYVDFYGGYAEHTRQVLFGLQETGKYNLKLTPIKTPIDIDPIIWNELNKFVHPSYFEIDKSDFMCIGCPGWFKNEFLPKERYKIGWTMIETYTAQPQLVEWMNNVDEIWCPTEVDLKRMKRSGVNTDLDIVHLGYDPKKFNENIKPLDIAQLRKRFVFGVLGSWNKRKGIKEIIQAFNKAFSKKDQVSLLLVCKYGTRPHEGDVYGREKDDTEKWTIKWEFERYLEEINVLSSEAPHITLLDVPIHEEILSNVMARFNCLVGFSRGESTWLPGLQAMAMGTPIIQLQSECGGYMDYLHDVGFLCEQVQYEMADEEDYLGTSELYEGCKLAKGKVDELADMMRKIYDLGEAVKASHRIRNGFNKAPEWTWKRTVNEINERLL